MKEIKNNDGKVIEIITENFKENYHFFKCYDELIFNPRKQFGFRGTVTSFFLVLIDEMWNNWKNYYDVGRLNITDGYWLFLLSIPVIIYWILLSIGLGSLFIIVFVLLLVSLLWYGLFEAPADALNKNKIDKLTEIYKLRSKNDNKVELPTGQTNKESNDRKEHERD